MRTIASTTAANLLILLLDVAPIRRLYFTTRQPELRLMEITLLDGFEIAESAAPS